jgi:hypothetical protein
VPVVISLVVALIAVAVAVGSWFKPAPELPTPRDPTTSFTDQQVSDAKTALCAAHDLVNRATQTAGGQSSDDPTQKFVIAVNIRVGSIASASYFLATLNQYPATSDELAAAVRETAAAYQEATLLQIALAPKEETDVAYAKLNAADAKYVQACQ